MVVREVLDNGVRLITETMPHVRSVTIGVWLTRGSRHEDEPRGGIAHFVEHMLFKGTGHAQRRGHRAGQSTPSAGSSTPSRRRNTPATTSRCSTSTCRSPSTSCPTSSCARPSPPTTSSARRSVILEEIKMVEDTPDDLVHELFTQQLLGEPSARPADPRHEGIGRVVHQRVAARLFPRRLRRAERDHLGGRQPRARGRARSGDSGVRVDPGVRRAHRRRRAAGRRRRSSRARKSSSRATSASGRPATRSATTTATSATS